MAKTTEQINKNYKLKFYFFFQVTILQFIRSCKTFLSKQFELNNTSYIFILNNIIQQSFIVI